MRSGIWFGALVLGLAARMPAAVRAANDEDIRKAVERGVGYLQNHPSAHGTWSFGSVQHTVGVSSLVGLALLECDVPADDPVVQNAARAVREGITSINDTYDLSLAVMFLDRLADPNDGWLIEAASLSLVAGQTSAGGWGYFCPGVKEEAELRRLRTGATGANAAGLGIQRENDGNQGSGARRQVSERRRNPDPLPPIAGTGRGAIRLPLGDDNSNTQFATLALWIARRHQVKVDRALAAVENRFRQTQSADGGWGYGRGGGPAFGGSTASMTCAGLLGLAVGYGVSHAVLRTSSPNTSSGTSKAARDPNRDIAIRRGLNLLGQVIEPALQGPGRNRIHNGLGSEYYFLWSLERVAMVYGLKTIGNKDWFDIGSSYLVQEQQGDGGWRGNLGDVVDTCFALFFLRRANLAGDLTATLRGKVRDAGVVNLRAGGVGGETLRQESEVRGQESGAGNQGSGGRNQESGVRGQESGVRNQATEHKGQKSAVEENTKRPASEASPMTPADAHNVEVARLRDQLVKATPAEQVSLLETLRVKKGAANTDALAAAIPSLKGSVQTKACDALAARLARMTIATLRGRLQDSSLEVRRAAALACAMKEDKTAIPELIDLLNDSEARVTRAAHAALIALSGEDFGPATGANDEERSRAISRWRGWWAKKTASGK